MLARWPEGGPPLVWKAAGCGIGYANVSIAEGMIYALGYQGTVSLLEVRPRGFEIVSQFELPRMPANTYLAHPVVCGGRLYIRCDDDLYAFDIRGK